MSDEDAVKARVEVLAKVFSGRLHVRFEKMDDTFLLCQAESGVDANWTELHRLLHSLADAAGSFGFDELGVQASRIALRVTKLLAQGQRHAHDIDDIGLALAALQRVS
jgi:HPt (histidine-containing phosphotransfer) domain-containing protein